MKAIFLTDIRKVELRTIPEPQRTRETDVLLAVETVGVCGSDMHYYRTGRIGDQVVQFPFVVGHECSARVLEIGPAVTNVKVGDRVAVDPLVWCERCDQCLAGRENTCRHQKFLGCPGQLSGCLCEQLVMPAASCFPVPDSLSADTTALLEPFCIGLYAQKLAGDLTGKRVAILGSGPIGLCTLAACRAAGAENVYMTDIRPERVAFALQFGADWAGNPHQEDVVLAILSDAPLGVDYVFEAAGEQETLDQAVGMLQPGGSLLMIGIPERDQIGFNPSQIRRKELTLRNVRRQNRCVEDGISLVASGKVKLDAMMTHHFTLDQVQEAFDLVADYKDGSIKAMIRIA